MTSKRDLLPKTPEKALAEALDCMVFVGKPDGCPIDIAQGKLMIAIENLMYLLYWRGGGVTEFVEGVLYEMFEEGYAYGDE